MEKMPEIRNYTFNFGPQHPAAHGVLRLILEVDGETIVTADPHVGLLHRATEKLAESKPYNQNIGYMDRLDYVSMMCNEHGYVLAIEKLLGITAPVRAQYIRVMFDEITRILNHLLWLGAHGLDIGAMTMFLYAFREREDLLDCYEAVSGTRMHATYYRPGGVYRDLPAQMPQYKVSKWHDAKQVAEMNENRQGSLLDFIWNFTERFPKRVDEYESLLTDNRIWKQRTVGIGVIGPEQAIAMGLTGVRVEEMRQSNHIVRQCVQWLRQNPGPVMADNHKVVPPTRINMKEDMEAMIHHFKLMSEGYCLPVGEAYAAIEHPKGEFGVYLVSDGANKPYRLKIRAAGFSHMAALETLIKGHMISDVVAVLSSLDIVFGEIDR